MKLGLSFGDNTSHGSIVPDEHISPEEAAFASQLQEEIRNGRLGIKHTVEGGFEFFRKGFEAASIPSMMSGMKTDAYGNREEGEVDNPLVVELRKKIDVRVEFDAADPEWIRDVAGEWGYFKTPKFGAWSGRIWLLSDTKSGNAKSERESMVASASTIDALLSDAEKAHDGFAAYTRKYANKPKKPKGGGGYRSRKQPPSC